MWNVKYKMKRKHKSFCLPTFPEAAGVKRGRLPALWVAFSLVFFFMIFFHTPHVRRTPPPPRSYAGGNARCQLPCPVFGEFQCIEDTFWLLFMEQVFHIYFFFWHCFVVLIKQKCCYYKRKNWTESLSTGIYYKRVEFCWHIILRSSHAWISIYQAWCYVNRQRFQILNIF